MKTHSVEVTELHMQLIRDLSMVVNAFTAAHPEIDIVEIISCVGTVAGALISSGPDEAERKLARDSVVSSLDTAIEEFLFMRQNQQ